MHILGQLSLERDRPRRHVQLVPPARQLAYVTERRQAVPMREVVCEQRGRGNKKEPK